MTGIEIAAVAIIQQALADVLATVAVRAGLAASPAARRRRRGVAALEGQLRRFNAVAELNILPLLNLLPPSKNLSDVAKTADSLACRAVIQEIVASRLCDGVTSAAVRDNFVEVFRSAWVELPIGQVDPLAEGLFDAIDREVRERISALELADERALERLRGEAGLAMLRATVDASSRHRASHLAFSNPGSRSVFQEWERRYRQQVHARHGHIVPPDFDRKRKVPLKELYVAPRICRGEESMERDGESIQDFMRSVDRSVLLGDPGGGKSTASDYIASEYARDPQLRVPFFVVLREFAGDGEIDRSIAEYIADRCASLYQCRPPDGAIEHILLSGRGLVIFDGLDELIDTTKRREVASRVELFSTAYPLSALLVTSRRVGYAQAQLEPAMFQAWSLAGFSPGDVREYATKWFSYVEELPADETTAVTSSFLQEAEGVPDLTATPLMLSLLCILYKGQGYIPKNRPAVYESCARLLFERWDGSRKIMTDFSARPQFDNAVKHLAFWMFNNPEGVDVVSEEALVSEVDSFLTATFEDPGERIRAATEFVEFCRGRAWVLCEAGTKPDGTPLFRFTHRTFMEYFAAYELVRSADGPEKLAKLIAPRVQRQEWEVVGQLAVQIADKHSRDGGQRVFESLLARSARKSMARQDNVLGFIWRCLAFVPASPQFVRELARPTVDSSRTIALGPQRGGRASLSIVSATGIAPELRGPLSDGILATLRSDMQSEELERADFASMLLVSWGIGPQPGRQEARRHWREWAVRSCRAEFDLIFGSAGRSMDVWQVGLMGGIVSMDEYAGAMAARGEGLLASLFRAPSASYLGWRFVDWADVALRFAVRAERSMPRQFAVEEWHSPASLLSGLGAILGEDLAFPLMSRPPRPFLLEGPKGEWSGFGDEDAHWATWILLACHVEIALGEPGSYRDPGFDSDELYAQLSRVRARVAEPPQRIFAGTAFEFADPARLAMRDAWVAGEVSFVDSRQPR